MMKHDEVMKRRDVKKPLNRLGPRCSKLRTATPYSISRNCAQYLSGRVARSPQWMFSCWKPSGALLDDPSAPDTPYF